MKIFITGGSGFIAQKLNEKLSGKHKILTQYFTHKNNCGNFNSIKLDLRDKNKVEKTIREFKPDVIVHAAAISKPHVAEKLGKSKTFEINVTATETLIGLANELNSKLIFFSTDLVYDGNGNPFKKETDTLKPLSLYARSKAEAEKAVRTESENYLILRTALHFGLDVSGAENHFERVYRKLLQKESVTLFNDQFRTPLEINESARLLDELLEANPVNKTINFGGNERVSRYELIELLVEECGFEKNLLVPISLDNVEGNNKVKDVSMNNSKLISYGVKPVSLREMIFNLCAKEKSRAHNPAFS